MAETLVMDLDLGDIKAKCLAPLDGDSPAGENARFEPQYDEAKAQIDKLTAVAAGEEGVDWAKVVDNSWQLLATKSKDFNLAAYLALGLLKAKSYEGLATGLEIILGLMADRWEDAFPPLKRMQARANLFNWIEDRIGEAISAHKPEEAEADSVRACLKLAQDLAQAVSEKVKVPVTGFSGLRGALEKWLEGLPAPEPVQEEEAPPPADEEDEAPDAPGPPEAQAAPAGPAKAAPETPSKLDSLEDGIEAARNLVNLIRAQTPESPLVYRLARVLRWDLVEEAPETDANGQTQIPGPRAEDMDSLQVMADAANWKDLAEEAESLFLSSGAFVLDLQWSVNKALEGLGFDQAAQAVAEETARFINRVQGIENYSFADERPFANPATLQWLSEIKAQAAGGAGQGVSAAKDDRWQKEALALAAKGKLLEALESLQDAVSGAPGQRQAIERRLAAANLCLDYHKPTLALPILEEMSQHIESTRLEEWAPEIFAQVYAGLVRGYQAQADAEELDNETKTKLENARRRLFDVDIALGAKLSQQED